MILGTWEIREVLFQLWLVKLLQGAMVVDNYTVLTGGIIRALALRMALGFRVSRIRVPMFSETHAWTCSSCVMGTGTCTASKGVVGLRGLRFRA